MEKFEQLEQEILEELSQVGNPSKVFEFARKEELIRVIVSTLQLNGYPVLRATSEEDVRENVPNDVTISSETQLIPIFSDTINLNFSECRDIRDVIGDDSENNKCYWFLGMSSVVKQMVDVIEYAIKDNKSISGKKSVMSNLPVSYYYNVILDDICIVRYTAVQVGESFIPQIHVKVLAHTTIYHFVDQRQQEEV